ncbi:MAG TPA: DegQ family serine endoprotease [Stellaceae bacterium]|nr:DegQ family serine endoprotease [Stellaceae bacterium]
MSRSSIGQVGNRRPHRAQGWLSLPLALVMVVALLGGAGPAAAKAGPEGFSDLAAKLLPAVVNISTTQTLKADRQRPEVPQFPPGSPFEEFFKDFLDKNLPRGQQQRPEAQPRRATSLGSGFIIDPSGLVVTNNHVIADADEITAILHDDTSLKAELVGKDTKTDLALLRVKTDKPLTAVPFGDSDQMKVGDWVLAIGNPFGLGGTVTAGIVSARARDIQQGPYDDFIQTDASINRGNSGGPMFNMNGEVVGINTAIYSPSGGSIGIGFAIPSALAKPVMMQLKEYGKTRRGWLGVRIQGVSDEIAESLGLDKARGALVASVSDKGPAQVAGIQPGDIVIKFDGKDVPDMKRLPRLVAETPIDKSVKVTVWRKRQEQVVDVKVGELDETEKVASTATGPSTPSQSAGPTVKALGLSLSNVTPELRQKFSLADDTEGVVVVEVAADSPASEKGLRPGDIIVEVAQQEVKDPGQVAAKIDEAKKSGRKSVLLLVDRAGDLRFVALRIDQS